MLGKDREPKTESRKSYVFFSPLASLSALSWPFARTVKSNRSDSFFFLFSSSIFFTSLGVEVLMSWNRIQRQEKRPSRSWRLGQSYTEEPLSQMTRHNLWEMTYNIQHIPEQTILDMEASLLPHPLIESI